MKVYQTGIAAVAAMLMLAGQAGAAVDATAFRALAKKKGCFNCHGMDRPILGPSLKDIGRKYGGDAGAQERLAGIIKNGSKGGVWGNAAMPAYARLGDNDIKAMVQFILSLK
ncbi:MAG TPA: c-type cytochrome [Gallionella sp.]|nr:c-type cytochrome [Gallionella sp.]